MSIIASQHNLFQFPPEEPRPASRCGSWPECSGPLIADSNLDWMAGKDPTSDFLIREGTICTYPAAAPTPPTITTPPVSVIGGTASTSTTTAPQSAIAVFPEFCVNLFPKQYPNRFRWKPLAGALTHGVLQVSTKPIPDGPVLSFPGLIKT